MKLNTTSILLLPGMDGTSRLFEAFLTSLGPVKWSKALSYPADVPLSYRHLVEMVRSSVPEDEPFVIVAESYSTPVAILFAGQAPANLKGVVLCAGFARSPLRGFKRWLAGMAAPIVFRLPLPRWVVGRFLVGGGAASELVEAVKDAVAAVQPEVLTARLNEILSCDVREPLAESKVPMMYLRAGQDRLVGAEAGEDILRARPSTKLVHLSGPHLLLQRNPAEVALNLAKFIEEIA